MFRAVALRSDEGLTLQTPALENSLRWSIYNINSVDKTKLLCYTPHWRSTTVFFKKLIPVMILCCYCYRVGCSRGLRRYSISLYLTNSLFAKEEQLVCSKIPSLSHLPLPRLNHKFSALSLIHIFDRCFGNLALNHTISFDNIFFFFSSPPALKCVVNVSRNSFLVILGT